MHIISSDIFLPNIFHQSDICTVSDLCVDQWHTDHVIVKKHAALPSEIVQLLLEQQRVISVTDDIMINTLQTDCKMHTGV